jgi:hypothetical protein
VETKPAEIGRTYPAPDPDAPIVVELASVEGTADLSMTKTAEGESKVAAPPPMLAGGEKIARIDDGKGKGGDGKSLDPARNLAAHAEEHTTVDETRDAIKDEQENRLKTGKTRKSNVDLRVALEPMELTFVASGKGFRYERHPVAKSDASLGFASGKGTAIGGAAIGGQPLEGVSDTQKNAGTASLGGKEASPASGAAYGNVMVGTPQLVGANVAKARPHVDKGKPSVTSNAQGLPSDTIDGDQATADAMKSLVSMSTKGGAVGDGKGGVGGGGAAGAGGASGDGSHAVALGDGDGPLDAPHAYQRTGWYLASRSDSVRSSTAPSRRRSRWICTTAPSSSIS